jgi:hypothetical protein
MPRRVTIPICMGVVFWCALGGTLARGADEVYAAPSAEEVRLQTLEWVRAHGVADDRLLERVASIWMADDGPLSARDQLERVIETFALIDPATRQIVESCTLSPAPLAAPGFDTALVDAGGEFYSANLRLFYARHLAQARMYDEALEVFAKIEPQSTVDPATCLFYRAVCEHQLLKKDEALGTLEALLERTEDVPGGYSTVATLMRDELQQLEEQPLGEVSRKMKDSERRLDLGRGGQRVQKVQDEIIAGLDEIIEKLEQQNSGGGGGGSAGNNSNESSSPADDSRVKGQTAPGEVDHKKLKKEGGWGGLPEKEAAKAQSLINRDFPSHYRRAVEEYFKKLADRPAGP